jgi:hypothetical protein
MKARAKRRREHVSARVSEFRYRDTLSTGLGDLKVSHKTATEQAQRLADPLSTLISSSLAREDRISLGIEPLPSSSRFDP